MGDGYLLEETGLARMSHVSLEVADFDRALAFYRDVLGFQTVLERDLGRLRQTKGIPRYRAMAEYTRLMLQLTKVNLITFAGWCREIAPGLVAKHAPTFVPPAQPRVDHDRRPQGIGHTNYCLCHGVAPFAQVDLPGGAELRQELAVLQSVAERFEQTTIRSGQARALPPEARRQLSIPRIPFWGLPARNTLDRATAMLPRLLYERLDQLGIATTPGVDFDRSRGHQFVRFSFAGSEDDMRDAVERLAAWAAAR